MFRCKSHHHQGAYYSSLLKLLFLNNQLKYIGVVISVVWLHILLGPCWCMCVALFGMTLR
jgi:hypothetical protein